MRWRPAALFTQPHGDHGKDVGDRPPHACIFHVRPVNCLTHRVLFGNETKTENGDFLFY
jgi:hypothetical protein